MRKASSVTFRAILLGVVLAIVSSYWASIGLGLASLPLFAGGEDTLVEKHTHDLETE